MSSGGSRPTSSRRRLRCGGTAEGNESVEEVGARGRRVTNVDPVDIRHLLDERGEHLVNELSVGEDDLLDSPRPYEVLDVPREVVHAEERGEDVDVVGELEDFRSELDAFGVFEEGAEDRDAVAGESVELDHVEGA